MKQLSRPRIGWGLFLLGFLVGWVFLLERHPKISFSCGAGGRAISEDWDSVAAVYGAVRGRDRNRLRRLVNLGLFSSLAVWLYLSTFWSRSLPLEF
jgi:hypothetical protein